MITYLNENTLVLSLSPPKKCKSSQPTKRLKRLETEIAETIKAAIRSEVAKRAWLLAQLKRSRQYEASLSQRGYRQVEGLPGWQPGPAGTKILVRR